MPSPTFGRHLWTIEEEIILRNNYKIATYTDLLRLLPNRTKMSIKLRAQILGIIRDPKCRRGIYIHTKYNRDRHFFSEPNLLNSYWAGFIAADGGIDKSHHRIYIKLAVVDKNHLETFARHVGFDGPIRTFWETTDKGTSEFAKIVVDSVSEWVDDLNKNFSIHQAKSEDLGPPKLDIHSDLALAYVAGYLDGDGSILIPQLKVKGNYYQCLFITFIGTTALLEWIKLVIDVNFQSVKYDLSNRRTRVRDCYNTKVVKTFGTGGQRVLQFVNRIKTFGLPLLERKWNKTNELILGRLNY